MTEIKEDPIRRRMRLARDAGRFKALVEKERMKMALTEEERNFIKNFKPYDRQ